MSASDTNTRNPNSNNTCFIISPIGDEDSDTRKRSAQMLKHVFAPAAKERGFQVVRADHISEPGIITSQVIQHVVDDPMVFADLTGRNPNVFYELALRHALKKPLVQVIKKNESIPFDVAVTRTVQVDIHDLDSVEAAKAEIVRQMDSVSDANAEIETPISVSLDLQFLRQSDNPKESSLADILGMMSDLQKNVVAVEQKLSDPETLLPAAYMRHLLDRHSRVSPRLADELFFSLNVLSDQLKNIRKYLPEEAMDSELGSAIEHCQLLTRHAMHQR